MRRLQNLECYKERYKNFSYVVSQHVFDIKQRRVTLLVSKTYASDGSLIARYQISGQEIAPQNLALDKLNWAAVPPTSVGSLLFDNLTEYYLNKYNLK